MNVQSFADKVLYTSMRSLSVFLMGLKLMSTLELGDMSLDTGRIKVLESGPIPYNPHQSSHKSNDSASVHLA